MYGISIFPFYSRYLLEDGKMTGIPKKRKKLGRNVYMCMARRQTRFERCAVTNGIGRMEKKKKVQQFALIIHFRSFFKERNILIFN